MSLQVDLFKNSSSNKNNKQVETRQFQLDYDIDEVRKYLVCDNKNKVDNYVNTLKSKLAKGRFYSGVGDVSSVDSLFELEALGLGKYSKDYQILFDFSDKLAYFMHRVTKCDSKIIERIPRYYDVSYALLNYDFSGIPDITFQVFLGIDSNIDNYFNRLVSAAKNNSQNIKHDSDIVTNVAYNFIIDLLCAEDAVKGYLASAIHSVMKSRGADFAYRSKNHSTIIMSCSQPLTDEVILRQDGFEDCIMHPKNYGRYEYAKEVSL